MTDAHGHANTVRPAVFIGSSSEGLALAEHIQASLDYMCDVEIWTQSVFGLGKGTLETLISKLSEYDFAVFLLTADDRIESRGREQLSPRDNILFELGLFMGHLGRDRTFAIYDRESDIKLPSDLSGITLAGYRLKSSGNLASSLGPACTAIRNSINSYVAQEWKQTIGGRWHTRYWRHDHEEDKESTYSSDAELFQKGDSVTGTVTDKDGKYRLSGTLDKGLIFTGIWSEIGSGAVWHGAFQFKIKRNMTMLGRWVGVAGSYNRINCGIWEMKRPEVEEFPSDIESQSQGASSLTNGSDRAANRGEWVISKICEFIDEARQIYDEESSLINPLADSVIKADDALRKWKYRVLEFLDMNLFLDRVTEFADISSGLASGTPKGHLKASYDRNLEFLTGLRLELESNPGSLVKKVPEPSGNRLPRVRSFVYRNE